MISAEEFLELSPKDRIKYLEKLRELDKEQETSHYNELRNRLREIISVRDDEKICSRYYHVAPRDKFYKDAKGELGLAYWCKDCMSIYRKEKYNTDKANNEFYKFTEKLLTEIILPHADRVTLDTKTNILKGHYRNNQELMKDLEVIIEKIGIETHPIPQIQEIEIPTQESFWNTLRKKVSI